MTTPSANDLPRLLAEDPGIPGVVFGDRYVVFYAVSLDHDDASVVQEEAVHSARDAARQAFALTRDAGSGDNLWHVFDTQTGAWATFAQEKINPD